MSEWTRTTFGNIAEKLIHGGTPSTSNPDYWSGAIPWITGADFVNQQVVEFRRYVTGEAVERTSTNVVPAGNLLLVTRTGVGKMAIAQCDIAISQDITGVIFEENIDVEFILYKLSHEVGYLLNLNQGSIINGIIREDLLKFELHIPSRKEQTRIAKILSTVDAAIEQTEALIAKYSRIRTGLMQDLLTRGNKLPLVPLSQLADVSAGITLGKKHEGPDTVERPYLRVANVQDGFLNLSEITYIRIPHSQVERYQLQSGDVLMNEGGDFDKLGRGTVWRDEIPDCLHQNHVFRVRCYTNLLLPDYLALISASPYGKRFFVLNSKQSTNLASINSTQLKSFPIPLPNVEEQQQLIDIFKKKTAVLDTHQNHLAKLQTLKKGLMQDLLSIPKNTGKESENCN